MSDPWFKDWLGGGQPQRRVLKGRVTSDAQGNLVFQPLNGQAHLISAEDSLDTIEPEFDAFLDCGCGVMPNQLRYHCCEPTCPHVVCSQHIRYCHICAKGTCPQCSYPYEPGPGQTVSLCLIHYQEVRRRQWWHQVARTLIRPFVAFDDQDTPK